jgi:hypothetical protein
VPRKGDGGSCSYIIHGSTKECKSMEMGGTNWHEASQHSAHTLHTEVDLEDRISRYSRLAVVPRGSALARQYEQRQREYMATLPRHFGRTLP